ENVAEGAFSALGMAHRDLRRPPRRSARARKPPSGSTARPLRGGARRDRRDHGPLRGPSRPAPESLAGAHGGGPLDRAGGARRRRRRAGGGVSQARGTVVVKRLSGCPPASGCRRRATLKAHRLTASVLGAVAMIAALRFGAAAKKSPKPPPCPGGAFAIED